MLRSDVASFPNLSDELLDKIVDNLDDESIIQLSMTCWKFHLLALPSVFTRANFMQDTTYFYLQQPPAHLLRALRIALFVHHITSFVVNFNPEADRALPEILSLNRFISRMPTMAMSAFTFPLSSLPLSPSNEGSVFEEERLTNEIIRLFNIVLDKSCVCLQVFGDMIPSQPMATGAQPTNTSPPRAGPLRRLLFEKIGERLRNLPNTSKHTILSIVPQNSRYLGTRRHHRILQIFHALSPDLFQSPFLNWTTSTLQTSSHTLTEVAFKTDRVPTTTWHSLLSKLTLPSLSKFRVTCDRIIERRTVEFDDMLNFLIRHPSIVELDFYGLTVPTNSRRPGNLLPALQTLKLPPDLVIWFLDCPYPLKQLRSLNMVSEARRQPPVFDHNTFDDALALLARSAPLLTTLTMSFFSTSGVAEWLDKYISRDHDGSLAALEGIATLEVVSPRSWEVVIDRIPRFLAHFPGLTHFICPALPPNLDMETVKRMFLRVIVQTCPGMRKVTIGRAEMVDLDSLRAG